MDEVEASMLAYQTRLEGAEAGEKWARTVATSEQVRAIGEAALLADERPEFRDHAVRALRGIDLFPVVDFDLSGDWADGFLAGVAVVWCESEEYARRFEGEPDHHVEHAAG